MKLVAASAIGALGLILMSAGGASAQPMPADADPIGALLRAAPGAPAPTDEDAAEAAGRPVTSSPEPDITAGLPQTPIPYSAATAPPSHLTEPVTIDEVGKTPDAPPSVRDLAYESRLRSSFASAQGFQGPLDGSFVLGAGGQDLFALELVDRQRGALEGAWRDLTRTGVSGFVDDIQRTANGDVLLRFGAAAVTLRGGMGGQWSGDLSEDGGRSRPVTLRRVAK